MTIGELIEVLSELAESEDYDPASPVYLVSGNETTPRPPKEAGKVVADADGSGATAFVEFLAAGKFV